MSILMPPKSEPQPNEELLSFLNKFCAAQLAEIKAMFQSDALTKERAARVDFAIVKEFGQFVWSLDSLSQLKLNINEFLDNPLIDHADEELCSFIAGMEHFASKKFFDDVSDLAKKALKGSGICYKSIQATIREWLIRNGIEDSILAQGCEFLAQGLLADIYSSTIIRVEQQVVGFDDLHLTLNRCAIAAAMIAVVVNFKTQVEFPGIAIQTSRMVVVEAFRKNLFQDLSRYIDNPLPNRFDNALHFVLLIEKYTCYLSDQTKIDLLKDFFIFYNLQRQSNGVQRLEDVPQFDSVMGEGGDWNHVKVKLFEYILNYAQHPERLVDDFEVFTESPAQLVKRFMTVFADPQLRIFLLTSYLLRKVSRGVGDEVYANIYKLLAGENILESVKGDDVATLYAAAQNAIIRKYVRCYMDGAHAAKVSRQAVRAPFVPFTDPSMRFNVYQASLDSFTVDVRALLCMRVEDGNAYADKGVYFNVYETLRMFVMLYRKLRTESNKSRSAYQEQQLRAIKNYMCKFYDDNDGKLEHWKRQAIVRMFNTSGPDDSTKPRDGYAQSDVSGLGWADVVDCSTNSWDPTRTDMRKWVTRLDERVKADAQTSGFGAGCSGVGGATYTKARGALIAESGAMDPAKGVRAALAAKLGFCIGKEQQSKGGANTVDGEYAAEMSLQCRHGDDAL